MDLKKHFALRILNYLKNQILFHQISAGRSQGYIGLFIADYTHDCHFLGVRKTLSITLYVSYHHFQTLCWSDMCLHQDLDCCLSHRFSVHFLYLCVYCII